MLFGRSSEGALESRLRPLVKDWSSSGSFDGAQTELWSKCTAPPELTVTLLPMTVPNTGPSTNTVELGA